MVQASQRMPISNGSSGNLYPITIFHNVCSDGERSFRAATAPFSLTGLHVSAVVAGRGAKRGACASGGTMQGAAFGKSKIWNSKIWQLLANWRLHCRQ